MVFPPKKIMRDQRGSVLVMGIIIASGIVIIGIEFSVFVVNSIRQARNIDSTITAFYAAESGAESLMRQVRNGGLISDVNVYPDPYYTCDRPTQKKGTVGSASWTVLKDTASDSKDPAVICSDTTPLQTGSGGRFDNVLESLKKPLILQDDSVEFSLYTQDATGFQHVPNLSKLLITWEGETCLANERPLIETNVVKWPGDGLRWEKANIKKDFQKAEGILKKVTIELAALDGGDPVVKNPMIVRIKLFHCDVEGVEITLLNQTTPPTPIPIPNYFTIQPLGSFRGVEYRDVSVTIPKKEAFSSIFDYTLYSEKDVVKNDPNSD